MESMKQHLAGVRTLSDAMALAASAPLYTSLLAGLSFVLFEQLCNLLLRPLFARALKSAGQVKAKDLQDNAQQCVTRVVGTLHNSIQIPLAMMVLLDPELQGDRLYGFKNYSQVMLAISTGYFLWDLLVCLSQFTAEGPLYLLHAVCCLFVFAHSVYTRTLHFHGAAFLMWELSTPFVHLRWFLYKMGQSDSPWYVANGIAMLLSFFLCRNVWGPAMSVLFFFDSRDVVLHPEAHPRLVPALIVLFWVANVAMNGLNAYWFSKMLSKAISVVWGGRKGSDVTHDKDE